MTSRPLISSIVASKRPHFIPLVLALFNAQTCPSKELILVEDEGSAYPGECGAGTIRLTVPKGTTLGEKTNAGLKKAHGCFLHKWDDDDIYGPHFLMQAAEAAKGFDFIQWGTELVLFVDSWELYQIPSGTAGTFVMTPGVFQKVPFRDIPNQIDSFWIQDYRAVGGFKSRAVSNAPASFIYVRHGCNTWTWTPDGQNADELLKQMGVKRGRPETYISPIALAFYRNLKEVSNGGTP
jgi:hypothetical protein